MEDFGIKVSQIAHDKNENGFDDTDVIGESRYESGGETPDDTD